MSNPGIPPIIPKVTIMKTRLLGALLVCSGSLCWAAEPLPRSSAEAEGVSSADILAFIEAADKSLDSLHSFMLVRHGRVVAESWWAPYNAESPHSLYSLSKSFTSTAVGLAIAEGKLSLDDEVLKFFPEDAPAEPSKNLKAMRIRDLLRMSTGHQEEPEAYARKGMDQDVPGTNRPTQARHAFPLQHVRDIHALRHLAEGDGRDLARLPETATL